jgi:hypothetical protein
VPQTVRSPGSGSPLQQRASPQCQSPPAAPRSGHGADAPAGTGLEDVLVVRKSRVERAKEAAAENAVRYEAAAPVKAAPAEPGASLGAGSVWSGGARGRGSTHAQSTRVLQASLTTDDAASALSTGRRFPQHRSRAACKTYRGRLRKAAAITG